MSEQPDRDTIGDELTTYSTDAEDQLQPEDTLIAGDDPVEVGYETPDKLHGSLAFGTTAEEQAEEETIDQRIRQEVPEDGTAYGAPDNEGGLDPEPMAGGDDPDAIPADQDFLGEPTDSAADAEADLHHEPEQATGEGDLAMEHTESAEHAGLHTITDDDLGPDPQS
ncbi:MAG: hypothetical protein WBG57_05705 [Ornithinimicrobium sp.]